MTILHSDRIPGSVCCRLGWHLAILCGLVLLSAMDTGAVGFRLPNQDPEGIARGNAFVATADNPSAIYYNPAGITQLEGNQARAGIYLISADTEYTSPTGEKAETDSSFQAVPQLYYTHSFTDLPLALGLGVYAPYGLSLDWGSQTPFRTAAESGRILYACVNPVIAWQIVPNLSIAIGPTINYSEAKLEQGITTVNPSDHFKFRGDGWAYGFNAGLRWQPDPKWAFGLNYRSATELEYSGHSEFSPYYPRTATHISAARFPQFVAGGISFRPAPDWNFEFDADWTDWDNLNTVIFHGTALGDIPFIFNYTSSWMYEFGVTKKFGDYFVSVGYIYSENSSPDKNFNPIVPDADLHLGSVGFGHHGKRWDWAIGYHFAYNGGREVKNADPINGADVNGTYRTFNNAVNIAATFKF